MGQRDSAHLLRIALCSWTGWWWHLAFSGALQHLLFARVTCGQAFPCHLRDSARNIFDINNRQNSIDAALRSKYWELGIQGKNGFHSVYKNMANRWEPVCINLFGTRFQLYTEFIIENSYRVLKGGEGRTGTTTPPQNVILPFSPIGSSSNGELRKGM